MPFHDVLPYCTDVEDGTENIFEDFGSNIGQDSSSGKIITFFMIKDGVHSSG